MANQKSTATFAEPIEYRLISEAEMLEREQKQMQRLQDVSVSCNFMKIAVDEFAHLEEKRAKREHWEHHLRCDGLPRPYLPPEIRTFLFREDHFQNIFDDDTVDWTLSVDERSILTQNTLRTDNTRRALAERQRDRIGERIEAKVRLYLNTLRQIETMLGNQAEMARLNFKHQMEIMQTRWDIEQGIENSFDYLTYRVIRMDGLYMDSIDAKIATWSHGCDIFQIDIWSLRNVSLRFDRMEVPAMMADFKASKVRVQMPLSVLNDRLTVRCVHTKFDMLTQNAKSFERVTLQSVSHLNAGILDIEDCLINEWYTQLEIQQELADKMRSKWNEYEETMELIADKMEKAAKEHRKSRDKSTGSSKHHNILKPPKQPLQLVEGMLPDPHNVFLVREESQYLDFLDDLYHPKKMNLASDEINLRENIMLGGIYSIMFVRRPQHRHFERFNITLHEDGRILHTMTNVIADLEDREKSVNSARGSRESAVPGPVLRRQSNTQLRLNGDEEYSAYHLDENELPYFFVTFKLSPDLCYWSEPKVCQFMSCSQVINLVDTSKSNMADVDEQPKKKHRATPETTRYSGSKDFHNYAFSLIQRRDSEPVNVFRPTLMSILRHTKLMQPTECVVPFENFDLSEKLNSLQLQKIQQFLLPRILSSFKFPIDFKEEYEEEMEKTKPQKGLVQLQDVVIQEIIKNSDIDFEYESQHSPERMFPIFSSDGPVIFPDSVDSSDLDAKNTSYGILNTIDKIKLKYMFKFRNISNQTDFEIKKSILKRKFEDKSPDKSPVKAVFAKKKETKRKTLKKVLSISERVGYGSNNMAKLNTGSMHTGISQQSITELDRPSVHSVSSLRVGLEESHTEEKKNVTQAFHWTTKYILESHFNREDATITLKTDRLGIFGLAFKRYEHFPFKDWHMQPNEENPEEIMLRIDTFHVRVILYISSRGIRGYVTDQSKVFVTKPKKYLEIVEPISDFQELRQRFWDKNINIFAEHDASFYIDNGYFTIKHVAVEDHTYDAMALHCKLMKFYRSNWNRLATRRNILLCMKNAKDNTEYSEVTVRITPDNATFVEVSELCSSDLDVFNLDYKPTWRNIGTFTDLHQIINSMNPHATEVRNRDSMLLHLVKKMLSELHILSFS
ncbi:uncharacterized protein [Drosophila tropicalis]|uniref:uncharacterized protein n=1 Tax=Drosophila tropicalis TaxID=46794 RepID=UPI0035ABA56F